MIKSEKEEESQEMKRIGMVVAIVRELAAVFQKFGEPKETAVYGNMDVYVYETGGKTLIVAHSGMGEIGAAAATELLISVYGAEMILNFGVVGGLTEAMRVAKAAVATKVAHYSFDASEIDGTLPGQYQELPDIYIPTTEKFVKMAMEIDPDLVPAVVASADRFVSDPGEKRRLHEVFGADICDMESAGIALTAYRHRIPVLFIKAVSDGITGGAEAFQNTCADVAKIALGVALRIVDSLQ